MRKLLLGLVLLFPFVLYAKDVVRMMGWTGYLTYTPELTKREKEIEKNCHVEISFDNYDSYDQMINLVNSNHKYDISIVSDTFFASISDQLTYDDNNLGLEASKNYNPIIRKHYLSKYPPNVGIFQLALSGFVYNPKVFNSDDLSFPDIIKASNENVVIFLDDPIEIANIIQNTYYPSEPTPITDSQILRNIKKFKDITLGKKIYFSDLHTPMDFVKDFAAHFIWSGEGLLIIEEAKKSKGMALDYSSTPALNYISMDVLSVLNNKPSTNCVAKALLSKNYLNEMAKYYYYFSPYISNDLNKSDGKEYLSLQEKFLLVLKNAKTGTWLDNIKAKDDQLIYNKWQEIRAQINYARNVNEDK